MTGSAPPPRTEPLDPAAVLAAHRAGRPLVLATSGSTGPPRRIVRSTRSWWASFPAYSELTGVGPGARVATGDLGATMHLFAATHALAVGADLAATLADATHAVLTPTTLRRELEDLPTGLHVTVAGAALPSALADEAEAAGLRVSHYYGAAELSFVAAGRDAGDLRPFPGVEVAVREGEIRVRSPYVAEPGSGALVVRDGWASVGDRGRWDGDRLVVLGRAGAVTTAGATVPVADVEAALRPRARGEVVVVGLPHDHLGEVLVAILTDPADQAGLRDVARRTLPASHRPRVWRVVSRLPRTRDGKLDRAALVGELSEASQR